MSRVLHLGYVSLSTEARAVHAFTHHDLKLRATYALLCMTVLNRKKEHEFDSWTAWMFECQLLFTSSMHDAKSHTNQERGTCRP